MDSAADATETATETRPADDDDDEIVHQSLHAAAAEGNIQAVQSLIGRSVDINAQDERGDSALHYAIEAGYLIIAEYLINSKIDLKARNLNGETALHITAKHDDHQVAELLVSTGADINAQDSSGCTALHMACQRHSVNTALTLIHCLASLDIVDNAGETALHKCCRENLLPVVQAMCVVGSSKECPVNAFNKAGQSALHLAARVGNAELVRCLLLYGADIELANKDGVRAEDIALGQGNTELADFLSKLSASMTFSKHDPYFSQLLPSDRAIWRIKVKLFGNCGVGKSTLIESLKCGYIRGLFRHFTSTASGGSSIMPTINEQSTDPCDVEAATGSGNSLVIHENCTRCVNIANVNVSGAGDLSLWEFSGYERYYVVYDHFVGDPNCIHIVLFRACDPEHVQLQQLKFWLDFLRARIAPAEPIGFAGTQLWAPRVLLVATHVDRVSLSRRNSRGETEFPGESTLVTSLQKEFGAELLIAPHIFTLDARQAAGADIKSLKNVLGEMKQFLCQYLPPSLGFLESTVSALPTWTRLLGGFPVVRWSTFVEYVRSRVHILATENHLQELICQLQLMGEVVYIESDYHDLIVLDPGWLFRGVIGRLLSPIAGVARRDGIMTVDDITASFPGLDTADLTSLLVALELCSPTADDNGGYHLACLNERQGSDGVVDVTTSADFEVRCGGVELRVANSTTAQLQHVFRRVQQALWNRNHHQQADEKSSVRLTEWSTGTEIILPATVVASGNADPLPTDRLTTSSPGSGNSFHRVRVSLAERGRVIRIVCSGHEPEVLYRFQNDVLFAALKVIEACCPGMYVGRSPVSPSSVRSQSGNGDSRWRSYRPRDVIAAMLLDGTTEVPCDDDVDGTKGESLIDLIAFGSPELYEALRPVGPDLHVSHLPIYARCRLAALLDPVHPLGRDWCLLAVALGLADAVPQVDSSQTVTLSRTDAILAVWSHDSDASVRRLRDCLTDVLQRPEVSEQLLALTPIVGSISPHRRVAGSNESCSSADAVVSTTSNLDLNSGQK